MQKLLAIQASAASCGSHLCRRFFLPKTSGSLQPLATETFILVAPSRCVGPAACKSDLRQVKYSSAAFKSDLRQVKYSSATCKRALRQVKYPSAVCKSDTRVKSSTLALASGCKQRQPAAFWLRKALFRRRTEPPCSNQPLVTEGFNPSSHGAVV